MVCRRGEPSASSRRRPARRAFPRQWPAPPPIGTGSSGANNMPLPIPPNSTAVGRCNLLVFSFSLSRTRVYLLSKQFQSCSAAATTSDPPEMGRQTNQSKLVCAQTALSEVPAESSKQASNRRARSCGFGRQLADQRRGNSPMDTAAAPAWHAAIVRLGPPVRRAQFSHCFAIAIQLTSASHQF